MPERKKQQSSEGEIDLRNIITGLVAATGVLAVLKLFGVFSISWWFVFLPIWGIVAAILILIAFILIYLTATGGHIEVTRTKDRDKPSV